MTRNVAPSSTLILRRNSHQKNVWAQCASPAPLGLRFFSCTYATCLICPNKIEKQTSAPLFTSLLVFNLINSQQNKASHIYPQKSVENSALFDSLSMVFIS